MGLLVDQHREKTYVTLCQTKFLKIFRVLASNLECQVMTEDMNDIPIEESSMPPNQVDQFVKISQTIKRRLEEDTPVPPKKVCQTFSCKEVAEDSRPPSTLEDPLLIPLDSCQGERIDDENKENFSGLSGENPNFDSILAKTLLAAASKDKTKTDEVPSSPKVIVEHQPLPSIYELGQVTRDLDNPLLKSDEESDGDSDDDSSMFDQPPPTSCHPKSGQSFPDRFWSGTFSISSQSLTSSSTSGPMATVLQPTTTNASSAPYQFLDQTNPRIECDENGKSYLQLGTFNHHIPVTPVIQPKPTTLTPRRPVHPFRPLQHPPESKRPLLIINSIRTTVGRPPTGTISIITMSILTWLKVPILIEILATPTRASSLP